jgi:hypothetical protein
MIPLFPSLYAALLQFAVASLFAALISESGGKVTPGFPGQAAVTALCSRQMRSATACSITRIGLLSRAPHDERRTRGSTPNLSRLRSR